MWKVFLLLVGAVAYGATAESVLTDISRNLQLEMERVREMAKVNYSNPVINATYTSKSEFDMRAMGSLYNATHLVIDFIANKQAYPEGMVSVSDGHLEIAPLREHWRELLAHYAGPTAVIVVTVLVAASLPLAGVFWCCCYWCKSGRRRRAFDRKYDACIKGLLAILMIALLTLFLFGVVCAFATESQLEEGAEGAPEGVRASLTDARVFLAASHAHAKHLLVDNYAELERAIAGLITSTGMAVSVHVGQFSGAASVGTLNNLVQRLDGVHRDLRTVHNLTAQLRAHADHLNSGLRKVKGQLLRTLAQCEQPPCVRLQEKYKIGQLDTEIQYNQMPDVSGLLANVSGLLASNIREEVADGARVFRDIQRAVQRSVDDAVPVLRDSLRDTGAELERVSSELGTLAASGDDQLRAAGAAADRLQALHAAYGRYRRLAGLAAAAALLAVTCLLSLGVTCGVCGKRPDVYGASDCCNKGAGASCLLCGTGCMFLVGGAAAVVLLAYFVVGLTTQRFICDPLTSPRDSRLFSDVEKLVRLEQLWLGVQADPALRLGAVLERCHQNYTIYEVLQLQRAYDVERLAAEARRRLAARVARLRPAFNASVTLLRPSAKDKLRALADAGLSDFNFDRILQALETNLTSLSLPRLAEQLLSAADGVQERAGYARVAPDLRRAADELRRLQVAHAQPMAAAGAQLANVTTALRDGLRFNDLPLKEAVAYLVYETGQAELYLKKQGPELVHNLTQQWGGVVGELLVGYAARVGDGARLHVGRCQPLSAAFNGTRALACHHLLLPVNGFWLSISWCLLLFVPLMVTAQRLARLYRHVDPYPGPLVEAEYLYDAYADRDNVPLANAYKAEKRAGRGRAAGGGGGGGGCAGAGGAAGPNAGGAGPALAPPLDAHHARRYNDMAPKHWEEGPPRYHGPTEYERPPPYYYPGPNDRQ